MKAIIFITFLVFSFGTFAKAKKKGKGDFRWDVELHRLTGEYKIDGIDEGSFDGYASSFKLGLDYSKVFIGADLLMGLPDLTSKSSNPGSIDRAAHPLPDNNFFAIGPFVEFKLGNFVSLRTSYYFQSEIERKDIVSISDPRPNKYEYIGQSYRVGLGFQIANNVNFGYDYLVMKHDEYNQRLGGVNTGHHQKRGDFTVNSHMFSLTFPAETLGFIIYPILLLIDATHHSKK